MKTASRTTARLVAWSSKRRPMSQSPETCSPGLTEKAITTGRGRRAVASFVSANVFADVESEHGDVDGVVADNIESE